MRPTMSPPASPMPGCGRSRWSRKPCAARRMGWSRAWWWRPVPAATDLPAPDVEGAQYRAGLEALARGTPGLALPLLAAAEQAGEGGGFAALNQGLALMQLGRLAEAAEALERAAQALPGHPEPCFRLGTIAGLRGEAGRAEALFRAALERDPAHV